MTDRSTLPSWEARFRAPLVGFPSWSRHAPDRLVYASNESGIWQLQACDLATGQCRQVTDDPIGVTGGWTSADGSEAIRAPILFIAGRNDSRCPLRQVIRYTDRLKGRRHPHELYIFETGHGSFATDEKIRQRALILDFLARHVRGIETLPGVRELAAALEVEVVGNQGARVDASAIPSAT